MKNPSTERIVQISSQLMWPTKRPRTPLEQRKVGLFGKRSGHGATYTLTINDALERLDVHAFRIEGLRDPILTINAEEHQLDWLWNQFRESDTAAALYFHLEDRPVCLPCDTYLTIADNIAAIAAHIEATRSIARYGVASVSEMFRNFVALQAPNSTPWWTVLQIDRTATIDEVNAAYRRLVKTRHPDHGGSTILMQELNIARAAALKDVANRNG